MKLTGPGGLLGDLTKCVLEAGLEGKIDHHLGHPKHTVEGRDGTRDRYADQKVITAVGSNEIDVPRDSERQVRPGPLRTTTTRTVEL